MKVGNQIIRILTPPLPSTREMQNQTPPTKLYTHPVLTLLILTLLITYSYSYSYYYKIIIITKASSLRTEDSATPVRFRNYNQQLNNARPFRE